MEEPRGAEGRQAGRRIAGLTSKKWPSNPSKAGAQAGKYATWQFCSPRLPW